MCMSPAAANTLTSFQGRAPNCKKLPSHNHKVHRAARVGPTALGCVGWRRWVGSGCQTAVTTVRLQERDTGLWGKKQREVLRLPALYSGINIRTS